MSHHNNSLAPSSHATCNCRRYATIGEWKNGIGHISYICPDCSMRRFAKPLNADEYYHQFECFGH